VTAARSVMTPSSPQATASDDDHIRLIDAVSRVPAVRDADFGYRLLAGGLTNRNYVVTPATGPQMVVRLSSPQSALLTIDRDAECSNARAAASTGVAPEVLAYAPEVSALVIEWIDGHTFVAADLDDTATLVKVAETCRRLHAGPRFATDFDMFELQRRYLDLVVARGFRLPASYLDFMPLVAKMRDALAVGAEPTVPCHNDLLAANIMSGGEALWFIDYEYSGNGDPCFELGNLCSESHLGTDRLTELVTAYYGVASPSKVARAQLLALMSDYGWTLWASIQSATSDLDFDFWAWGMEKYERALERLRDPGLHGLITDVQQP
jgi:thiamine kinase-like enzyme